MCGLLVSGVPFDEWIILTGCTVNSIFNFLDEINLHIDTTQRELKKVIAIKQVSKATITRAGCRINWF